MDAIKTDDVQRLQALQTLAGDYITAWSTSDSGLRNDLIARVYADDAEFFSSEDGDLRLQGRAELAANIGQVNARDIQGRGLAIKHTGTSVNHQAVTVKWQMVTSNGSVALSGMNVLMLNGSDEIAQDFIFIG